MTKLSTKAKLPANQPAKNMAICYDKLIGNVLLLHLRSVKSGWQNPLGLLTVTSAYVLFLPGFATCTVCQQRLAKPLWLTHRDFCVRAFLAGNEIRLEVQQVLESIGFRLKGVVLPVGLERQHTDGPARERRRPRRAVCVTTREEKRKHEKRLTMTIGNPAGVCK